MFCPRCRANVGSGRKFCGDCGSPLPVQCTACGNENPPGKRFCADCGAILAGSYAEPGSTPGAHHQALPERRQLTVMFVDLVGSTSLGVRLDPEDLRDVINTYQQRISAAAARFDGLVARYTGDGALVYFGSPRSHEDDAERAVHAGLAIVDAVSHLNTVAGPEGTLACRVGIATGPVIVGDVIGFGSSLEPPVVGDTPNLAAALVTMASPGTVAIADTTRRLAGELFEYRSLGPAQLKGTSRQVRGWAVLAERAVDSRFEALRTDNLPLVGRAEELEFLLRRWAEAQAGAGRVVLLTGEPGIGKSRLVVALEHSIKPSPHALVRLACSPHHTNSLLYPFICQIERAAKFERADATTVKLEKLAKLFGADIRDTPEIGVIADLLSLPHRPLPELNARQRREMTLSAILRQLNTLRRDNTLLLVLEDLHWADPTTLDLLEALTEKLEQLPILLVATSRPELSVPWSARPQVTVQPLSPLHRHQAASLIKAVAGGRELPGELVERIILRADGVPLFIEELTKSVFETGLQSGDGEQNQQPLASELVPATLQASLMLASIDSAPAKRRPRSARSSDGNSPSNCCGASGVRR
jgi:class 3 adenylate cyclase